MSQHEKSRLAWPRVVVGALAFAFVLEACGDDDATEPDPVVHSGGASGNGAGGSGGSGESGAGGSAGTIATGGAGGSAGAIATGGTAGGGGAVDTGGAGGNAGGAVDTGGAGGNAGGGDAGGSNRCVDPNGPDGCYACEPNDGKTIQFLNRCTDSSCSKFDNAARIPDFALPLPPL